MKKIYALVIILISLLSLYADNCGLSFKVNYPHAACAGQYPSSDSVSVTILTGSPPFRYYWSNGDTTPAIVLSGPINFWIVVVDSNICGDSLDRKVAYDTIQLKGDQHVLSIKTFLNENTCVDPVQAQFTVQVNLFPGPDSSRIIYHVPGIGADTSGYFTGLTTGIYSWYVVDTGGCILMKQDSFINVLPTIATDSFNIRIDTVTCKGDTNGQIIVTPYVTVDAPWKYSIDSVGLSSDSIFTGLSSGEYVLVMRNRFGCVYYDTVKVDSQSCGGPCSAHFALYADTSSPHHYFALNQSTGIGPLSYTWAWGDNSAADTIATPSHIYADSGYYNICLTIADTTGCTSSFCDSNAYLRSIQDIMIYVNVVNSLPTGIPQLVNDPRVSVYPNPNSIGSWELGVTNELVGANLEVIDEQGRLVFNSKLKTQNSKLELNIPSGVYYLRISNENTSLTKKLIKL